MKEEIQRSVEILKSGGVICYPTDTIWGIGCDATNVTAVTKVGKIKKRDDAKSLIVLLANPDDLEKYVKVVPEIAWDLLDQVEDPLTIIYPGARNLAKNVIAEDGSVGIRVVHDEFCKMLIQAFGKPIVSTSANFSGEPHPLSFGKISPELLESVDYVVDYNRTRVHHIKPSSIIKLGIKGEIELIRK